jgi:hypothetical protein
MLRRFTRYTASLAFPATLGLLALARSVGPREATLGDGIRACTCVALT